VRPAHLDESRRPHEDPVAWACRLAAEKASAVAHPGEVVVAADTVVHRGGEVFDKPRDRREARSHLASLAAGVHWVTTGVCVRSSTGADVFGVTTAVRFRPLTEAEIDGYVATGEADDKAGAYGIQGRGGAFVAEVHGSWTNVMGLPLEAVIERLDTLGCR
jgi:septum formation protein